MTNWEIEFSPPICKAKWSVILFALTRTWNREMKYYIFTGEKSVLKQNQRIIQQFWGCIYRVEWHPPSSAEGNYSNCSNARCNLMKLSFPPPKRKIKNILTSLIIKDGTGGTCKRHSWFWSQSSIACKTSTAAGQQYKTFVWLGLCMAWEQKLIFISLWDMWINSA